ncbi:MAG: hypothetical protein KDK55_00480 [Chlamydiia bacterium]|nr:hypothetical protein [Chlamydiia bacterium]
MKNFIRSTLFVLLLSSFPLFCEEEDESGDKVPSVAQVVKDNELIAASSNLGPSAVGFPPDVDFGPQDEDLIDPRVLRDFIESRGLIRARKCDGCLTIAGDVRVRWLAQAETVNGTRVRGSGSDVARNTYRSEVNLFFDYVAPKSWVSTKLKWAQFDGQDGGTMTKVSVDRAFLGYDVYHNGDTDFYIEAGRSKLNSIYDSRVQFAANFDGIHIYYTTQFPEVCEFIVHGGPFLVDSFTNDYAWVAELEFLGLGGTGFSAKYSYTDWLKKGSTLDYGNLANSGKTNIKNNPRYKFRVSQVLLGYQCKPSWLWCKTLNLFGATLINHAAEPSKTSDWKKLNRAWYVGFVLGRLCKACDWSLEFNYQAVGAQAVPEFDLLGIGHGNAADTLFSDAILQDFFPARARGFTNYRGYAVQYLFAMTESLSLKALFQRTVPLNKNVGGNFRFKYFELAAIYAF